MALGRPLGKAACAGGSDQQHGRGDAYWLQTKNRTRTCREKSSGNGEQPGGVSLSALTSSCGRRLMRIRSAFSLSCLLSMRARRSLEALSCRGEALAEGCPCRDAHRRGPDALPTFSCRTRSMRYLQRGLMSFRMRAVMISIPLDSWVTMQLCRSNAMCYPMDAASLPRSEMVPCLQH